MSNIIYSLLLYLFFFFAYAIKKKKINNNKDIYRGMLEIEARAYILHGMHGASPACYQVLLVR